MFGLCAFVRLCVCAFVCLSLCLCVFVCLCVCVQFVLLVHVCMYVCMYVRGSPQSSMITSYKASDPHQQSCADDDRGVAMHRSPHVSFAVGWWMGSGIGAVWLISFL